MKIYELESNIKIYNGDVFDALSEIEDNSIDLIFIDPPYNIGKQYKGSGKDSWFDEQDYLEWCYDWLDLSIQKLSENGTLYLMSSTQYSAYFDIYIRSKLHIMSRIVWHYDSSGKQAKTYFGSLFEPIFFAVKNKKKYVFNSNEILVETITGGKRNLIDRRKNPPKPYNKTKVPGNVWYYPRVRYLMPEYINHPSQKPESLLERIILVSSNENDTVLDIFAGTFTTGVVALRNNRKYIGIEISDEYVKDGIYRMENRGISSEITRKIDA